MSHMLGASLEWRLCSDSMGVQTIDPSSKAERTRRKWSSSRLEHESFRPVMLSRSVTRNYSRPHTQSDGGTLW